MFKKNVISNAFYLNDSDKSNGYDETCLKNITQYTTWNFWYRAE